MDAICEARLNIVEIVADIDNAVLWKAGCGYGAGQDFALVATAIGSMSMCGHMMPQPRIFQAKFGSGEEVCRGDANFQVAKKILQKFHGSRNDDGLNDAICQLLFENVQVIGDDFGTFTLRQAMAREDFRDDVFVVTNGIGIPVAGNILQAVASFKWNKEGILLGAGEFEKHAIDIKDYRRIHLPMILPQNWFPLLRIMWLAIDHGGGHFNEGWTVSFESSRYCDGQGLK